jgi:hypothetical protein
MITLILRPLLVQSFCAISVIHSSTTLYLGTNQLTLTLLKCLTLARYGNAFHSITPDIPVYIEHDIFTTFSFITRNIMIHICYLLSRVASLIGLQYIYKHRFHQWFNALLTIRKYFVCQITTKIYRSNDMSFFLFVNTSIGSVGVWQINMTRIPIVCLMKDLA